MANVTVIGVKQREPGTKHPLRPSLYTLDLASNFTPVRASTGVFTASGALVPLRIKNSYMEGNNPVTVSSSALVLPPGIWQFCFEAHVENTDGANAEAFELAITPVGGATTHAQSAAFGLYDLQVDNTSGICRIMAQLNIQEGDGNVEYRIIQSTDTGGVNDLRLLSRSVGYVRKIGVVDEV